MLSNEKQNKCFQSQLSTLENLLNTYILKFNYNQNSIKIEKKLE